MIKYQHKNIKKILVRLVVFQFVLSVFAPLTALAAVNTGSGTNFGKSANSWDSPQSAASSDNIYATAQPPSNVQTTGYHKSTGFGFNVPPGAVINGIVVKLERSQTKANCYYDEAALLMKDGITPIFSSNKAVSSHKAYWPTVDTIKTYGSSTDLWGQSWTAAEINSSGFGFGVDARRTCLSSSEAKIDHVSATVYYTATDTEAPVITLNGANPLNVVQGSTYAEPGAIWTDDVDGTGNALVGGNVVNMSVTGTYVVTYNYTDVSGKAATQVTRTVNVQAAPKPVLGAPNISPDNAGVSTSNPPWHIRVELVGDLVEDATCEYRYMTGATTWSSWLPGLWSDKINTCYGDLTEIGALTTPNFTGQLRVGTAGGVAVSSPISRQLNTPAVITLDSPTVTVKDTTVLHTITGHVDEPGVSVTIYLHDPTFAYEYWVSTIGSDINNKVMVDSAGNWTATIKMQGKFPDGVYDLEAQADDGLNVTSTYGSYVVDTGNPSLDTQPPVITVNGSSVLNLLVGDAYTELGATWTDNIDGTGDAIVGGDIVNTSEVGTYTVSYNYTDAAGNMAMQKTRQVNVDVAIVDVVAPVITLKGFSPMDVEAGSTYIDPGATWSDDVDGMGDVVGISNVNTAVVGSYTVTYNHTDAAGNVAQTVTRTVNVVGTPPPDTVAPVITLAGTNPTQHLLGMIYVDAGATAVDAVDGAVNVVKTGSVNVDVVGPNTITYTATDAAGNIATATRTVNVVAASKPGDITGDGLVDVDDLTELAIYWNMAVAPGNPADLTGDGFVDIDDLTELAIHWPQQ